MELNGRNVVITGGVGGLGAAVVDALVAAGATCYLPVRGKADGPAKARIVVAGEIDLTDEAAVGRYYAGLPALWASVHLAGGYKGSPLLETTLADVRGQLEINFVTSFLCCREAVRNMRVKAGSQGGRLVNVGSRAALVPGGGNVAYAASKAAVAMMTRSLAEELKEQRILVNAVMPSIIDTPANRAAMAGADFSKWPKPGEIAPVVAWLVSPSNGLTSGELVTVYGRA